MIYGIIVLYHSEIPNMLAFAAFMTAIAYLMYFLSPVINSFSLNLGIPMNAFFLEWSTLIAEFLFILTIAIIEL